MGLMHDYTYVKMKATGCPLTPAIVYSARRSSKKLTGLYVLVIEI